MKYVIKNNKDNELYIKDFKSFSDCKHWIINTLDLSKEWTISNGLWNTQVNYNFEDNQVDNEEDYYEDYIINSTK